MSSGLYLGTDEMEWEMLRRAFNALSNAGFTEEDLYRIGEVDWKSLRTWVRDRPRVRAGTYNLSKVVGNRQRTDDILPEEGPEGSISILIPESLTTKAVRSFVRKRVDDSAFLRGRFLEHGTFRIMFDKYYTNGGEYDDAMDQVIKMGWLPCPAWLTILGMVCVLHEGGPRPQGIFRTAEGVTQESSHYGFEFGSNIVCTHEVKDTQEGYDIGMAILIPNQPSA